MNELAQRWRRELAWGGLASLAFAAPSVAGQVALGRALGRAGELAALLSLGSSSRLHLALQPVDAAVGGVARLLVLAGLVWLLAWVLLGARLPWRGVVASMGRAARVLAWGPVAAAAVGGVAGYVWFASPGWAGEPALWELAYPAMKGWVATQGLLWLWVLARFGRFLAREHGLRLREGVFLGLAPAWALLLMMTVEGWLP